MRPGATKLSTWRKRHNMTKHALGEAAGVSGVAVGRYEEDEIRPALIVAVRFEILSAGDVRLEDWEFDAKDVEALRSFARAREGGCCALARWAERTGNTVEKAAGLLDQISAGGEP